MAKYSPHAPCAKRRAEKPIPARALPMHTKRKCLLTTILANTSDGEKSVVGVAEHPPGRISVAPSVIRNRTQKGGFFFGSHSQAVVFRLLAMSAKIRATF